MQIIDVRADHTAQFFDTMVARTYVGYGASTLGVDSDGSNPQPAQHFGQSGSPGTFMAQALPLPGAMMNHFVLANYNDDDNAENGYGQANSMVKILKFYPGAEMTGQVTFADDGQPLENVRLLSSATLSLANPAKTSTQTPTGSLSASWTPTKKDAIPSLLQQATFA